jgi:hypothetical protein
LQRSADLTAFCFRSISSPLIDVFEEWFAVVTGGAPFLVLV